ncbi:unnamed protein product [Arctia plantaginis]|uniref:Vanin C-terminal domain-containing protein n=1 Tax=Arctia plantaginis TaxID=874455 RepID=A0A8S0Z3R7_ARCPL|nr:unnamed protein product [Arctia plantaginis]
MKLIGLVICLWCVNFLDATKMYRAGVLQFDKEMSTHEYVPFVYEAGKRNVDILVLPSLDKAENYDEAIKSLSKSAKAAGLYVVAHLYEKARCQNKVEMVESYLVFDREGSVISVYRKPVSNLANCISTSSDIITFTTDFGVTFGLAMKEDIVLRKVEFYKGLKNIVVTGAVNEASFLSGPQFLSSWSYMNNVNLISNNGIFLGKSGFKIYSGSLVIEDLYSNVGSQKSLVPNIPSTHFKKEDLSQYVIKPLDLEASATGYKDTVCHGSFCCEFYVKTTVTGSNSEASYGIAAFDGIYPFTGQNSIGVQNCAVFACSGLYKRSCELGTNNTTNIIFEKISVTANFTKPNAQYPIIQVTSELPVEKFKFDTRFNGISTQVTLEIVDSQNVVKFGIFGRDYTKDLENFAVETNNSESTYDIYDYIFNEDVQEFFDYLWIRLRILLVVVSIYVLEMM